MSTTQTLLTFEEFEQLPEHAGKRELVQGEVIELPPAEYRHNKTAEFTWERLKAALASAHSRGQAEELGETCFEIGYKLPDGSYVIPDVSITHAGQPIERFLLGAPALAIEIISPSNRAGDIDAKISLYFQYGAREVWVFYPKSRRVAVHFENGSRVVRNGDSLETPLLPGFSLKIGEIFG